MSLAMSNKLLLDKPKLEAMANNSLAIPNTKKKSEGIIH
jgi:hypothetical protein